jgi:chorismate synthase
MVANLYDERYRTRRRIEALRPPHALSVEALAYERDDYHQRRHDEPKQIPAVLAGVLAGAFLAVVAGLGVLGFIAWWAARG